MGGGRVGRFGCLGRRHRRARATMQMLNLLLASGATAFVVTPPPLSPSRVAAFCPRIPAGPYACAADAIYPSPTAEQSAELETAIPTPALQPREVIGYVLTALHKSNFDTPRARFGCEVALRFLAPSNPASGTGLRTAPSSSDCRNRAICNMTPLKSAPVTIASPGLTATGKPGSISRAFPHFRLPMTRFRQIRRPR